MNKVLLPTPDHDEVTHKLRRLRPIYNPTTDTESTGWEVIPRDQEEIDEIAEEADHESRRPRRAVLASLAQGEGTEKQTQKTVAWVARQLMGKAPMVVLVCALSSCSMRSNDVVGLELDFGRDYVSETITTDGKGGYTRVTIRQDESRVVGQISTGVVAAALTAIPD